MLYYFGAVVTRRMERLDIFVVLVMISLVLIILIVAIYFVMSGAGVA